MRIAYLIIAHDNPKHLQRLINALSSESSAFFIHIDLKSNMDDFSGINGKNVYFCEKRIRCFWGDFSVVRAILSLIRMALADDRYFDYFPLLSGTDYPVQPTLYIKTFFSSHRHNGTEFIDMVQMPNDLAGKPIWRLTTYQHDPADPRAVRTLTYMLRLMLVKTGFIAKKRNYKAHLRGLTPYGGNTWWALSREACTYILSFVDENPQIVDFFTHTIMPDESFFQTVLANSRFRPKIRRGLTYANWEAGGKHPALISEKDLELFEVDGPIIISDTSPFFAAVWGTGEILFARKFSDDAEEMVAKLDQIIKEKEKKITTLS